MPHFKAGMINLQYEIRICHKIHDKGTTSKWQHKLRSFKVEQTLPTLCRFMRIRS